MDIDKRSKFIALVRSIRTSLVNFQVNIEIFLFHIQDVFKLLYVQRELYVYDD